MLSAHIEHSDGRQAWLVLENDRLKAEWFLPRGAEMIGLTDKRTGIQVIRQVEGYRAIYDHILAGLTDYNDDYANEFTTGAWFEMFPHAGRAIPEEQHAKHFHGDLRYHWATAGIIAHSETEVVASVTIRGTTIAYEVTRVYHLRAGESMIRVGETITNRTGQPLPIIWGQHPTFGLPFIEGAEIETPAGRIIDWKRKEQHFAYPFVDEMDLRTLLPPSEELKSRMYYLTDLREGWGVVRNRALGLGVRLEFDKNLFPYLWYWNTRGGAKPLHDSFALEFVTGIPFHIEPQRFLLDDSVETEFSFGFC